MRLEITRRSDLATRSLLELARLGRRAKSSELADLVGTTSGFLSQAITPLTAQGWILSEPGPSGGYALNIDPHDVSVLQIIEAVEGPTDTGRCVLADRPCGLGRCALHEAWSSARSHLLAELASTSIASLEPGAQP